MDKNLIVNSIDTRLLKVGIKGVTPLLMHRFADSTKESILNKQQKKGGTGREARNIEKEVEESAYKISKNSYGLPASAFKGSIVGACRQIADKSLPMTVVKGAVHVMGFYNQNGGDKPKMGGDYVKIDFSSFDTHESRVTIGAGTTDIRFRPRFYDWTTSIVILYNAGRVSLDQIVSLIQLAGFSQGVGDFRPSSGGFFGQYQIDISSDMVDESFDWSKKVNWNNYTD